MPSDNEDRTMSSQSASTSAPSEGLPGGDQPAAQSQPTQPGSTTGTPQKKKKEWKPISMPTGEEIIAQDMFNNCFVKSAISGAMGGVAGVAFGLFSASMENAHGGLDTIPEVTQQKTTRVILKEMFMNLKTKSVSYAKGFAMMGALYSFNECVIEKYRAKHDKVNPALAGCVTGAMLAHSGGPQAMCFGCASFAAFSTAIEYWMES